MLHILYTGNDLRQRRRETISHPPEGVQYTAQHDISAMAPEHKLTGAVNIKKNYVSELILRVCAFLQIPNIRYISNLSPFVHLIHTPGQLIMNKRSYFVEIDNVGCLGFYRYSIFNGRLGKRIIRFFLRRSRCRGLICISEAAKKSIVNFFKDDTITQKCYVSYPYVSDKSLTHDMLTLGSPLRLLFISSDFYLKGGREVMNVFKELSKDHPLQITIITKLAAIKSEDLLAYQEIAGVNIIEGNLSKEELYNEYYLKSDIFVVPTYMDSFGLVFLEALSSGLAIITTDMFATTEMVEDGVNGYILSSPLSMFAGDYTPDPQRWGSDIHTYCKEHPETFQEVEKQLFSKMKHLLEHPEEVLRMKHASLTIYVKKFHDDIRKKHLKNIYLKGLS